MASNECSRMIKAESQSLSQMQPERKKYVFKYSYTKHIPSKWSKVGNMSDSYSPGFGF